MAGYLTTHVLDTANGRPAAGMKVGLYRLRGEARTLLAEAVTNADGRTGAPILGAADFATGAYELLFHVGDWLGGGARFLDIVPVRFTMSEDAHYHVPLLVSPFGYSTYRGS